MKPIRTISLASLAVVASVAFMGLAYAADPPCNEGFWVPAVGAGEARTENYGFPDSSKSLGDNGHRVACNAFLNYEDIQANEGRMKDADDKLMAADAALNDRLDGYMSDLGVVNSGIAMSMAMASIPANSSKFTIGAALGHYQEKTALAAGIVSQVSDAVAVKMSLGYASDEIGAAAGVSWSF